MYFRWNISSCKTHSNICLGILLFTITLPNVVWTLQSSPKKMYEIADDTKDTFIAYFGGIFFMFCSTSFLFILTYMSYMQFYVITWPLKAKTLERKTICLHLTAVFAVAILPAIYPSKFPSMLFFCKCYFSITMTLCCCDKKGSDC